MASNRTPADVWRCIGLSRRRDDVDDDDDDDDDNNNNNNKRTKPGMELLCEQTFE